jgi:hypothetical protein
MRADRATVLPGILIDAQWDLATYSPLLHPDYNGHCMALTTSTSAATA